MWQQTNEKSLVTTVLRTKQWSHRVSPGKSYALSIMNFIQRTGTLNSVKGSTWSEFIGAPLVTAVKQDAATAFSC